MGFYQAYDYKPTIRRTLTRRVGEDRRNRERGSIRGIAHTLARRQIYEVMFRRKPDGLTDVEVSNAIVEERRRMITAA